MSLLRRMMPVVMWCCLAAGCATTAGPVKVKPLPEKAKAETGKKTESRAEPIDRKIGTALDEIKKLVDSVPAGRLGFRSQVLKRHSFAAGTALGELFTANGLFVRFDPPTLGARPTEAPLFLATVGDLLSYVEDVLGLYVRAEDAGTFVVSECVETAYDVPPDSAEYFRPRDLSKLMSHPNARVTYFKVGKLYVYDDRAGHRRIAEYVKAVNDALKEIRSTVAAKAALKHTVVKVKLDDEVIKKLQSVEARLAALEKRLDDKALEFQIADLRARILALEQKSALSTVSSVKAASPAPTPKAAKRVQVETTRRIRRDRPASRVSSSTAQKVAKSDRGRRQMIVYVGSFRGEQAARDHAKRLGETLGKAPKLYKNPEDWWVVYYKPATDAELDDIVGRLKSANIEFYVRPKKSSKNAKNVSPVSLNVKEAGAGDGGKTPSTVMPDHRII